MADKKITDLQLRSNVDSDVNFPVDDGIQSYRVTSTQVLDFISGKRQGPTDILNYSLSTSIGASALTIALKNSVGSNASSGSPVNIAFRNATSSNGTPSFVSLASSLSLVVPSGATLGTSNGVDAFLYVYAINNAGAIELGISKSIFDEGSIQSTTAITSGSGSDSLIYSTTARSNKAIRLLGRLLVNESTAGTWASNSLEISLNGFYVPKSFFASTQVTTDCTHTTSTSFVTLDNSPAFTFTPQISGLYKVYASIPIENLNSTNSVVARIFNTSGGAVLLYESQICSYSFTSGFSQHSDFAQSVYQLTAGVSYVFDIQGKVLSGGDFICTGAPTTGSPFYMFAELV